MLELLGSVFQIGAGAAGLASQIFGVNQQEKFQQQVFEINSGLARQAYFDNVGRAFRERQAQRRQASFTADQVRRDALEAAGATRAQLGRSGVGGQSAADLINTIAADDARFQQQIGDEQDRLDFEAGKTSEALTLGLQSQLFSLQPDPQTQPDILGGIFNIGSGAVGAFKSISQIKNG